MKKTLQQLKEDFNPTARNALSTEIISMGATEIPVLNGQIFMGADNVVIAGNVTLENGAVIQRGTSVIAESGHKITIGQAAPIMDHVIIHATKHSITIGNHVTIAHASHLNSNDGPITFANESFGNINMRVTGGTVERDGYLGPGVTFSSGDTVPLGEIYFGTPLFKLGTRTENGEITEGTRIIKRRNIKDVSQQLYNDTGKALTLDEYPGYEKWSKALNDLVEKEKSRQQDLPFEEWLRTYSLKQLSKAALYMADQARVEGPVVWHSAVIQSDILHLAKAKDILAVGNNHKALVASVDHLIKAQAYLLGAYTPKKEEEPALANAFVDSTRILEVVSKILSEQENVIVSSLNKENAVSAASGKPLTGAQKEQYTVTTEDINKLRGQIETISQRTEYFSQFLKQPSQTLSLATLVLPEVRKMEALKDTFNKGHVNITQIPDGISVKSYDGAIPVIADNVTLVGKVDLVGNIRIDSGAIIQDSTLRTEQRVIPVTVRKNSLIQHTIIHTAGREQTPVEVAEDAFINGKHGNMVVLHGPYIGHGSYVGPRAVVADEVLASGIFLPRTVLDGVEKPGEWHVYGGNVCGKPLRLEKEITGKDGYMELPQGLQNPDILKDPAQALPIIRKLHQQGVIEAEEILQKKINEYGDVYKYSAYLQVDLLSLETASHILSQTKTVGHEVLRGLKGLQEGYQYLLGMQESISAPAASIFLNKRLTVQILNAANNALMNIKEEGIFLPLWREGGGNMNRGREEIRNVLDSTIHPSFKNDDRKDARKKAVDERLNETWFIPKAEIIQRLVPNLNRIPERVESLLPQPVMRARSSSF